jgi:AraC-like DNA-binding protein
MQLDALLHDVGAKAALLSLFAPAVRPPERFRLFWAKDWPELQGRAEAGITDVAILDPFLDRGHGLGQDMLHRLFHLLGGRRPILYLSTESLDPTVLQILEGAGFPHLLTAGVDDRAAALHRELAMAGAAALLDRLEERLKGRVPPPALEVLMAAISSWSPGEDTPGLARRLGLREAELRRALGAGSFPTLRECLGWGRLFFALGSWGMREETVTKLAKRVGYGDRSSLCRLCRRLTNSPATEVFTPEGPEVVMRALENRLVG